MINLEAQTFASWAEPIEMLYACHSKVKGFCKQLQILPDYLEKNGVNQAVKNDVQQILTYFNQAAPLHHQDEEEDFFPALVKIVPSTQQDVEELARQHLDLHKNWALLSAQLQDLLEKNAEKIDRALVANFIAGYERHIALEEPLFEQGRQHLSAEQLQSMGDIMAKRRQIK